MLGRRSHRQRVRRTRRARVLRLVPLLAVTAVVAALLVVVTVSQLRTEDTAGTPVEVEKREFVVKPAAEREPYTPEDAALVAVADPAIETIQDGEVVAELAPHDLPDFELLGVTWTGGVPADVAEVQVRWQQDGQWSPWTILDPEAEAVDGGIPGTEPKWIGPSQGAQARIVASADIDPAGLTLVTVAPGESPTLTQAAVSQPNIISRASWGARSYGGSGCGAAPSNGYFQGTIVHHTAGSNTYTAAQSAGIVRSTQAYHMDGQKWCDIGYNFLIDRYGQVFEGRAGGITSTPYGAHAGNTEVNKHTTGVSLMGEFTSAVPPDAMKNALVQLVAWRHAIYGIPAKGGYSIGGVYIQRIDGHRSVKATACPGQQVFNWINAPGGMRDQVEQVLTSSTGFPVTGGIGRVYNESGGPSGVLGQPTMAEKCGLRDGGCYQDFQGGVIHYSPATDAHISIRGIKNAWQRIGAENSALGYPTMSERCGLRGGGCYQDFQGGVIHYSPATDAQVSVGIIKDAWQASGAENGPLGYPTMAQTCGLRDGGCYQDFQGGVIHSSPATGAQVSIGGIKNAWQRIGAENSQLGYPTMGERCGLRGGGCYQDFQGGVIHYSPATDAQVSIGGIKNAWQRIGAENSQLGYPKMAEKCGLRDGGCYQDFQGGAIYWAPATDAYVVWGAVRTAWQNANAEKGALGYPTSSEQCSAAGCTQTFQGGSITWTRATDTTTVKQNG